MDKQNLRAQRQGKFAAARSGQTQGSADVSLQRETQDAYLRGVLETERRAQAAGNSLRQADQSSKLNLFSMAQGGLDMTTAARQAGEQMRSNIGMARAEATQQGIGDAFAQLGDIYKRSREEKGKNSAEKYQFGTPYAASQFGPWAGGYGYPGR